MDRKEEILKKHLEENTSLKWEQVAKKFKDIALKSLDEYATEKSNAENIELRKEVENKYEQIIAYQERYQFLQNEVKDLESQLQELRAVEKAYEGLRHKCINYEEAIADYDSSYKKLESQGEKVVRELKKENKKVLDVLEKEIGKNVDLEYQLQQALEEIERLKKEK